MRKPGLLLLTNLILSFAIAQKPLYTHQQWFKVEDGLPQSFVSDITQDEDGFIWISTLDGLARYDGRSFVVFRQKKDDSLSLSSNVIYRLTRSEDNLLWIFYQGKQNDAFNPRTNKVTLKKTWAVNNLRDGPIVNNYEDVGRYWTFLAEKGVGWLDATTGQRWYASTENKLLRDDSIIASSSLPGNRIVLLSRFSIQISDSARKQFSYTPLAQPLPVEISEQLPVQMITAKDNLVAVSKNDVWIINYKTGTYKRVPSIISGYLQPGQRTLRKGPDERIYIRGIDNVYRMESDGSFTVIWQNNLIPGRRITCIFVDRTEVLWIGLDAGGLVKVNLRSMPLNAYKYDKNFHADILVKLGLDTSAMPANWTRGSWSYNFRYSYGPDSTLYISRNDSPSDAPQLFAYKNNKLRPLPIAENASTTIRGIVADKDGGIWALDNNSKAIWHWKNDNSVPEKIDLSKVPIHQNQFADLAMVNGIHWTTTYGMGLFKTRNSEILEHADKESKTNNIPYDLTNICPDPKNANLLWIGSLGGGLVLWDVNKGVQRIFTTEDGLPNNTIYCIAPDRFGKLWMSTNKGICRFDPVNYDIQILEKNDGLPGNEFNRAHKFVFPDGRIALGGIDGYVIFHPADFSLRHDTIAPTIQITEILINNQVQLPGASTSLVKASLNLLTQLELPYNKNYITISFAALQFNEPLKIKYRYRLKGMNSEWTEIGYNNTAYYTDLRPGDYTLEINATNINGEWSESIRSLSIKVLPPIWATWWAYGIYIMLAVTAVLYYLKYRDRRLKDQQRILFEHREAERLRELDEVKTRFFSNITHEFRTPLTLIITPLEKIAKQNLLPAPVLQTIDVAQRNAEKLLRLINQLLDLSRLEAGQMKLYPTTGELSAFVADCINSFSTAAIEKRIKLSYEKNAATGYYQFDEDKLEKVIVNLLGNAIKFTPPDGTINVKLARLANEKPNPVFQLTIEDSGPGIPKDSITKIFDRFYQVDHETTRQYEGSGIGLSLVRELTKLMGGTIKVENRKEGGARFLVEIPVTGIQPHIVEEPIRQNGLDHNLPISEEKELPVILIAEDNSELRTFLADSFAERWKVIQTSDGLEAWDLILQEMPDLVVSDLMMPGRDGVELCNLCKTDPRTAHIGFILLTARSSHAVKMEGLATGADAYITKPFHLDELELQVHNLLQLHEKLRTYLQSKLLPSQPPTAQPNVENPFIVRLYALLDEKLDDPQLNVEYLSSATNMSRSSLNRKLKSILNISANELIRHYRLQKAAALLRAGEDISSTAYKTGFSSPSYFAQCFREQYHQTPTEWVSRLS